MYKSNQKSNKQACQKIPKSKQSEIYYYYYKDLFTHKDINTYINGVV